MNQTIDAAHILTLHLMECYSSAVESSTQSVSVVNKLLQSYDKDVRPNADQGQS